MYRKSYQIREPKDIILKQSFTNYNIDINYNFYLHMSLLYSHCVQAMHKEVCVRETFEMPETCSMCYMKVCTTYQ